MSVTIKDVAKLANVSAMTASRVINNSGMISEATRERVVNAIHELKYTPNVVARTLAVQSSKIASLIVPDIANPFFSELIKTAEVEMAKFGKSIFICDTDWHSDKEREYVSSSLGRMYDGIIIVTPRMSDKELEEINKQIPLVVVDRCMSETDVKYVYVDNYQGAYNATEYLIKAGHSKIGYIRGWEDVLNTKRREQGYADALRDYGIPFREDYIHVGDYREKSGYGAFRHFLELSAKPTAVFASNDMMAYGFISACIQNGLSVPDDISVMGFDDIKLFFEHVPGLSTVRHPLVPMIKKAVHLLFGDSKTNLDEFDNNLKTDLVIRQSVKEIKQ